MNKVQPPTNLYLADWLHHPLHVRSRRINRELNVMSNDGTHLKVDTFFEICFYILHKRARMFLRYITRKGQKKCPKSAI